MFRISEPLEAAAKEASVTLAELDRSRGEFSFGGAPYLLVTENVPDSPGIYRGQIMCPLNNKKFHLFLLKNGVHDA